MEVQLLKKNNFKPNGNPMNDGCRVEVRNGDVTGAMRRFKKNLLSQARNVQKQKRRV